LSDRRRIADQIGDGAANQVAGDANRCGGREYEQRRRESRRYAAPEQEADHGCESQGKQESQGDRHKEIAGEIERVDKPKDEKPDNRKTHKLEPGEESIGLRGDSLGGICAGFHCSSLKHGRV
jgi:hypothetical protein